MDSENIRMLAVGTLRHHPDNPRKSIGDIEELTDSIRKNGIMQNLTVVPAVNEMGAFWVLIGNRRFEAAKRAGLDCLPCLVAEGLSEVEQVGIMLEENMQRSDLTIIEQAQGFQLMLDMGETVSGIAQRTGFSESTVRRRVRLNELDGEALAQAAGSFQLSMSDLVELEKIEDVEKRNSLLRSAYSSDSLRSGAGAALREQERRKGIDRITARLRELGFEDGKYKPGDYWSSKYEVVKRFAYDINPETIKDIENSGDMGYGEHYGEVYLMRRAKPEKEKKELTPEEKRQRELAGKRKQVSAARDQMLSEFREFLKEKFRDTGILRHTAHISDRENREAWEVLCGFGKALIYRSVLCGALLPKEWYGSTEEEKKTALRQLSKVPVPYQMAWALCEDIKRGSEYELMDWDGTCRKEIAAIHDRLYCLLRIWGFRFTEEREEEFEELLEGESELYVRKEEKENGEHDGNT